jgi:PAS domain S-box-containing protein
LRYSVAVLAVAAVLLLKLLLDPMIPMQSPFLLFAGAVVIGAWFGGLGPGVLATVLGALAGEFFAWVTQYPFMQGFDFVPLSLFVVQGLVISLLVEVLHSARWRAQESMVEAQSHQEALRQSEERFRSLVKDVRDYAIIMLDQQGCVASWNEGAERIFGYSAEEIIGEHISIFHTEEDVRNDHPEEVLRVAAAEGGYEGEGLRVCKDGTRFWASVVITALTDDEGNLRGFSNVERDITERKRAEEALKESERRYRTLVEQMPAITYVQEPIESSTPKAITYISPQYETILGYLPNSEVMDEAHWLRTLHPEDRERVLAEEVRTDETGEPFKVEYRIVARDGRVAWVRDEATLVRDEEGHPLYWLGVRFDVTEQKRAEEALRESERKFRTLVEQIPAITYIEAVDHGERRTDLLYISPQVTDVFGYSPEEWTADSGLFERLLHPDDRERVLAEDIRTDITEEPFSVEYRQFTRDGRIIWLSDEAILVRDEMGRPLYWQGVVHDITDQKRIEDALRQSEELYRTVVEQAAESIYIVDVETRRIHEANAAFHDSLGYSPEELEEMTLYDIVAHDRESVDANIERIVQKGHYTIGERRYRRKDGSLMEVEVSVSAISYGGREAMCIVAHDVTERKRMENSLRNSLGGLLALREAGQILGSTLESEAIVARLLEIMRGVSNLTTAVISVPDERGEANIWRSAGLEGLWRNARFAPEATAARRAALEDEERHLFLLPRPELGAGHLVGLCLPLRSKDRVLGVLEVYGPESMARRDAVDLLASLASQAASALESSKSARTGCDAWWASS